MEENRAYKNKMGKRNKRFQKSKKVRGSGSGQWNESLRSVREEVCSPRLSLVESYSVKGSCPEPPLCLDTL